MKQQRHSRNFFCFLLPCGGEQETCSHTPSPHGGEALVRADIFLHCMYTVCGCHSIQEFDLLCIFGGLISELNLSLLYKQVRARL
jgi:hypothetical protein